MAIIVNLDVVMAKRKISSTELSQKLGITMANLSILKNNKAKAVRFTTLNELCKILNCQPGDILEYVDDEGEYVTQVGHDNDRYIIAKTNLNNYYLLDTKEPIVYGPFTEEKFIQVKENVKIPESVTLKNLDKYKKIK